jgi:hypothetical protein
MAMGHGANYADVIEESELIKIGKCGKLLNKLRLTKSDDPDNPDDILIELAQGHDLQDFGVDNKFEKKFSKAYDDLVKEFNKVTGLELSYGYHDSSNDGDRYDDIDGFYWSVEGVYQLTKAGKKYSKIIDRKLFVTFG